MEQLKKISVEKYWDMLLKLKSTLVIMGTPGLCKTTLPGQVAESIGGKSYVIPVAQFSETGDIQGCPDIVDVLNADGTPKLRADGTTEKQTIYAPPAFFPTEGKGFIVIDDFNRANSLIIQSLLHLAQYREFGDYKLPDLKFNEKGEWVSGFKLVFTGNQNTEEDNYIVNEVDDAFYSRTLCWELKFDKLSWGKWAMKSGIEEKFVSFMLKNSTECITSANNPRAWSNGFMELRGQSENLDHVSLIMSGCVTTYDRLKTWLMKEWTTLNFDSNDVFEPKLHKGLMDIFKDCKYDGKMLFAERLATLPVKDLQKDKLSALQKFLHLLLKADKEKFMVAFTALNRENSSLADDELFEQLIPTVY